MTGDTSDIVARLKAVLPTGWFPVTGQGEASATPVLDGILTGIASCFSWLFSLIAYADLQSRIRTATDVFLDIIALDFFGGTLARKPGQTDASLRTRILNEIIRPRATRASLTRVLVDLTDRAPTIFEPALSSDTGGYGYIGMTAGTGLAYGMAGGWGSLALPFQCFITAFRAPGGGIPSVAGYYTGSGWAGGGYGVGALEWANLAMSLGQITDTDIDNAIVSVLPAATIAWTRISN